MLRKANIKIIKLNPGGKKETKTTNDKLSKEEHEKQLQEINDLLQSKLDLAIAEAEEFTELVHIPSDFFPF